MGKYSLFEKYIERISRIRSLSTLSLDGIYDAAEYNRRLRENFVRIGDMAAENRKFLDECLFPLLNKEGELTEEEVSDISCFEERLMTAETAETLDLPIAARLSERLLQDAFHKEQLLPILRQMDVQISVYYSMQNMTYRMIEYPEIAEYYRKKGFELGDLFIRFREKEHFQKVDSEEARELILTNARFASALFENLTGDSDVNKKNIEMLRDALKVSEDPFYTELMPDYDWRYYRYRVLDYYGLLTVFFNHSGIKEEDFPEICERSEEMWDLWHSDPEYFSKLEKESYVAMHLFRNQYFAGKISSEEYREKLLDIYRKRDKTLYDLCGAVENILIPVELLGVIWKPHLTEADKMLIHMLDNNVTAYAFHMPNNCVFSSMLEYTTFFLRHFVEYPGGTRFEKIMLRFLAAMHPPTYVHSRMVAHISACLCGHLIDQSPELLIGVEGCSTAADVIENRDAILWFVWHAAICHDTGKIFIIDTVFVYGRKLLDMEFDLIKTHPKVGAEMLKRFSSTAKYAEVALGHHKWYDNSRGYPEEFDTSKSRLKTVIDLVMCADGLDAATDNVGRSYNRGKSFDDFYKEVLEGSGTRYAPWLPDLLSKPEVRKDIGYLLSEGREKTYYDAYQLLKAVHEKEI